VRRKETLPSTPLAKELAAVPLSHKRMVTEVSHFPKMARNRTLWVKYPWI